MGRKPAKRRDDKAATPRFTKVTIRLDDETARRLAVESAMTRKPMGTIVESVLGPYLRRWRLPSAVDAPAVAETGDPAA